MAAAGVVAAHRWRLTATRTPLPEPHRSLRILHRTSSVTNPAMNVFIHKAEVPRFRCVCVWGGGYRGCARLRAVAATCAAGCACVPCVPCSTPPPHLNRHHRTTHAHTHARAWHRAVHEEVIKLDQDFGLAYSGGVGWGGWDSASVGHRQECQRAAPTNLLPPGPPPQACCATGRAACVRCGAPTASRLPRRSRSGPRVGGGGSGARVGARASVGAAHVQPRACTSSCVPAAIWPVSPSPCRPPHGRVCPMGRQARAGARAAGGGGGSGERGAGGRDAAAAAAGSDARR